MYASALSFAGLYTFPNPLANIPVGGALQADNLVANKDGEAETRRGLFANGFNFNFGGSGDFLLQLASFQNSLIAVNSTGLYIEATPGALNFSVGGVLVGSGNNTIRPHFQEANKNLYITTNGGIFRTSTVSVVPIAAGVPPGLDGSGILSGAGSGFLGSMAQCAYQIVFGYVDANGNLNLGNPSQRILVVNATGGSDNVTLTFSVPLGLTTSYFYQIYRTPQTVFSATPSLNVPPGAELQLAGQFNLTSGQLSALSVTVTDVTTDALLGAALYTNPSQQGALQTNDRPPFANDFCLFSQMMFYANTHSLQMVSFNLIAVTPTSMIPGLTIGDVITIGGTTYTCASSQNNAAQQFALVTSGTVASNIDLTARNLVNCINANVNPLLSVNIYAFYTSGFNDLPGQIELQNSGYPGNDTPFYVTSSNGAAFSPVLPSSGTSFGSSDDVTPNGIYVSKVGQPEAVPVVNLIFVGGGDQPIIRILPLRDRVIVLKTDGVFVITGSTPSTLSITLLDTTIICIAPESARLLNNSVYCMTQQGVVSITESGVTIQSRAIEGDLLSLTIPSYTHFQFACYATSYESERLYILGMPTTTTDAWATQCFCYNWITNAWTHWSVDMAAGIVNPFNNQLYLSRPTTNRNFVYQERKNYNYSDYMDDTYSVTITGVDATGLIVSLSALPTPPFGYTYNFVGMGLAQTIGDNSYVAIIDSFDAGSNTVTVDLQNSTQPGLAVPWANATALIEVPIAITHTYAPITGGFPHYMKSWTRADFWFNGGNFPYVNCNFTTDVTGIPDPLAAITTGLFGFGPYGPGPFGGNLNFPQKIQTLVPTNQAQAFWIMPTLALAFPGARYSALGTTLTYDIVSDVSG